MAAKCCDEYYTFPAFCSSLMLMRRVIVMDQGVVNVSAASSFLEVLFLILNRSLFVVISSSAPANIP